MNTLTQHKTKLISSYFSIYIFWGATFIAITYGLKSFPPFILTGLRFLIAGLLLLLYRASKGDAIFNAKNWGYNAISGILILTGGTGLVVWAEQYVSATEAAVAIGTGPFWFILLDKKNWTKNFSNPLLIVGLILGFSGLILFLKNAALAETNVTFNQKIIAYFVLIASSISWVLGALYSRKNKAKQPFLLNSSQQLIAAGLSAFIFATLKSEWGIMNWSTLRQDAIIGLTFLIFFGSIIAYIAYTWLIQNQPASRVSTHTYVNPIVAAILGFIFIGTKLNHFQIASFIIILIGVILINVNWKPIPSRYIKILFYKKYRKIKQFTIPFVSHFNNL